MKLNTLSITALALLSAVSTQAQVLAEWAFTGDTDAATTVATSVTAGDVTVNNITFNAFGGQGDTPPTRTFNGWSLNSTLTVADEEYVSFTLQADTGFELNLTEFSFDSSRNANGPETYDVRYSIDNFATTIGTGATTNNAVTLTTNSIVLSDTGITDLVEFRIYGTGATGNAFGALRLDDIAVSGTVTVPELSSASLIAGLLGVAACTLRRRRS
ncbi:MAG: hypothetical protein AAF065_02040 [Verrucomicrobiota bacterium]